MALTEPGGQHPWSRERSSGGPGVAAVPSHSCSPGPRAWSSGATPSLAQLGALAGRLQPWAVRLGRSGSTVQPPAFCLWLTRGHVLCVPHHHLETPAQETEHPSIPAGGANKERFCLQRPRGTGGPRPPRAAGGLPAFVPATGWARACCRPSGQSASSPVAWPDCRKVASRQRAPARSYEGACH